MPAGELTQLLRAWNAGDADARSRLIETVYAQLRTLARAQLRREHGARTLSATGLVHEAYLRLCGQDGLSFHDRAHFYGIAAVTMRRVLVEAARRRGARKRGGDWRRVTLGAELGALDAKGVDLLDLDRALTALAAIDERQARVVELRFFAELSVEETAEALGLSPATVKREWSMARAWLFRQLERTAGDAAAGPATPSA
jgi:RNA polymerase sigma factor (TIGR02999 family)